MLAFVNCKSTNVFAKNVTWMDLGVNSIPTYSKIPMKTSGQFRFSHIAQVNFGVANELLFGSALPIEVESNYTSPIWGLPYSQSKTCVLRASWVPCSICSNAFLKIITSFTLSLSLVEVQHIIYYTATMKLPNSSFPANHSISGSSMVQTLFKADHIRNSWFLTYDRNTILNHLNAKEKA